VTLIISFIILLYLFSAPYIRLQQRQSRFKYTLHIFPGKTALLSHRLARLYVFCGYNYISYAISIISQ